MHTYRIENPMPNCGSWATVASCVSLLYCSEPVTPPPEAVRYEEYMNIIQGKTCCALVVRSWSGVHGGSALKCKLV